MALKYICDVCGDVAHVNKPNTTVDAATQYTPQGVANRATFICVPEGTGATPCKIGLSVSLEAYNQPGALCPGCIMKFVSQAVLGVAPPLTTEPHRASVVVSGEDGE